MPQRTFSIVKPDAVRKGSTGAILAEIDKAGFGMHALGGPAYQWLQTQLAAATGDYEAADKALYTAKAAGRNRSVVASVEQLALVA